MIVDDGFPPSRSAGLERLGRFVPNAAENYALGRNTDAGPDQPAAVSRLSPYVRYRMVSEQEVVAAVLARHPLVRAEKYVQEVLWRTYWKGWLEMRPQVWARFLAERDRQRDAFPHARALSRAEAGETGIEGFDDWARELVSTGYLHNHARMWFASIWIFTLRLPWALGADFFLRHLIDADAASNTLSWRWVAGLQTVGKTYLASADNISRYTNGRFAPSGLANHADPLTEAPVEPPRPIPEPQVAERGQRALLLVTHEDMWPDAQIAAGPGLAAALVVADDGLLWGDGARKFVRAAAEGSAADLAARFACPASVGERLEAQAVTVAAQTAGVRQIVTPYAPTGPVADRLRDLAPVLAGEGIALVQVRRDWDSLFWPHAKKGFFPFKQQMPRLLAQAGLANQGPGE